jgi:hypothetical protein
MKFVVCNGKMFEVRNVGEIVFKLTSRGAPIKAHGTRLMSDEDARQLCRDLLDLKLYDGGKV